jgi:50S ribosomal protein L16 3-hydroxylase
MKNGLAALIYPMNFTEFLDHYKKNKPFVIHHGPAELQQLRDLSQVSSLEALLASWPDKVQVHLPDLRDEASAIEVSASEAKKYFDQGMGLLFNDTNRFCPILQEWVKQLRSDLGVSAQTYGRSLIYATPDGQGTAPHFDQNINFVLQIHGTKKWKLASNQSVTNPMERHTMGQPVDPEMLSYLNGPMPDLMPAEEISIELKPGSLLFVPRGVWHSTEAQGHALALNFTFTAPTWADLLLGALRSRLVLSPEWRETALVEDERKFEILLATLMNELPHWHAGDILEATEQV